MATKSETIGAGSYVTTKCESKFGDDCEICNKKTCLVCSKKCSDLSTLDNDNCKCTGDFIELDQVTMTNKNMGDTTTLAIPNAAGVTVVDAGSSCTSGKCCWKGSTSGSNCDAKNGEYLGCNRTVCNYAAAKAICENFGYGNKSWRLPSKEEMAEWGNFSVEKSDNGLMLCDLFSGYNSAYCSSSELRIGADENACNPALIWSHTLSGANSYNANGLNKGSFIEESTFATQAASVSCVTTDTTDLNGACGAHCLECSSYTACTLCEPMYRVSVGVCVLKVCDPGYFLHETGECKSCGEGCNKCATATTCAVCKDGYYLSGGACLPCTSPCKTCSGAGTSKCTSCIDGYYSVGSWCSECYVGCKTCTGSGSRWCTSCEDGYYYSEWSSGTGYCNSCSTGCTCTSSSNCLSCREGYYKYSSNSCRSCYTGCKTCTSNNSRYCKTCFSGYYYSAWSSGTGYCNACVAGCDVCSNSSSCATCKSGWTKSSGNCYMTSCWTGCSLCTENSKWGCYECQSGYYNDSGRCYSCSSYIAGCLTCSNSYNCTTCQSGWTRYKSGSYYKCQRS